jgi:hypothetical protein
MLTNVIAHVQSRYIYRYSQKNIRRKGEETMGDGAITYKRFENCTNLNKYAFLEYLMVSTRERVIFKEKGRG